MFKVNFYFILNSLITKMVVTMLIALIFVVNIAEAEEEKPTQKATQDEEKEKNSRFSFSLEASNYINTTNIDFNRIYPGVIVTPPPPSNPSIPQRNPYEFEDIVSVHFSSRPIFFVSAGYQLEDHPEYQLYLKFGFSNSEDKAIRSYQKNANNTSFDFSTHAKSIYNYKGLELLGIKNLASYINNTVGLYMLAGVNINNTKLEIETYAKDESENILDYQIYQTSGTTVNYLMGTGLDYYFSSQFVIGAILSLYSEGTNFGEISPSIYNVDHISSYSGSAFKLGLNMKYIF